MPIMPQRSISFKMKIFNAIHPLDYNLRDRAGFYIGQAIAHECRLIPKLSKNLDMEKKNAKQLVFIGKYFRNETKQSLRNLNLHCQAILTSVTGSSEHDEAFFQNEDFVDHIKKNQSSRKRLGRTLIK